MILLAALAASVLSSLPAQLLAVPPEGHKIGSIAPIDECDRPLAQFPCGVRLLTAGKIADGVALVEDAAMGGDNRAKRALGLMLIRGEYVPQNSSAALRWFHSAAGNGDRASMAILATIYRDGIGTPPDPRRAALWQSRAAR